MTQQAQHTPGPWRYTDGGIIDNAPPRGHAGVEIADVLGADTHDRRGPVLKQEARANAAFIVRACNSHDDLLAACKFALDSIASRKRGLLKPDPLYRDWATVEYQLSRAIALAEEGE